MICWQVCHQSGRVLFTTDNEVTARNREQFGWKVIKVDNRYELASQHGMSKEYIDWFFDKMKDGCGNQWFIMMAAMWEGWQASRSAIEIELPRVIDAHPLGPQSAKMICAFHKNVVGECAESIRAAGIKVKE